MTTKVLTPTTYVVKRDNEADLKFKGVLLGEAASSLDTAHPSYSGETGRATELTLYRTVFETAGERVDDVADAKAPRYVCQRVAVTQWEGENDAHEATVVDTTTEVIGWFGYGDIAKRLYDEAEIDATREI